MRTDGNRIRSLWARLGFTAVACAVAASAGSATFAAPSAQPAPRVIPTHQVEGSILDREGGGVAGATVVARPVTAPIAIGVTAHRYETVTDRHGRFWLDDLPPGTYWFIAYHADHPTGSSPAVPVVDTIEIVVQLDDESISA